jgi:hypothetical protein
MSLPEFWLRGPIPDIPPLLQPVAHALLQAREEVESVMSGFPEDRLWTRPGGVASVGFHLQHLQGVLDRLFTYARGGALNDAQLHALAAEGIQAPSITAALLIETFRRQVELALAELRTIDVATLTESRAVGRSKLPSTVLGLLIHSAEHIQRHVGQLLVTVRVQL